MIAAQPIHPDGWRAYCSYIAAMMFEDEEPDSAAEQRRPVQAPDDDTAALTRFIDEGCPNLADDGREDESSDGSVKGRP